MLVNTGSVRGLYPVALAEGEGVGTAYEYLAKERFLRPVIERMRRLGARARLVVTGLPEKYGASLDFVLLAARTGATLEIVDERQGALDRAATGIEALRRADRLGALRVAMRKVERLEDLAAAAEGSDAILCSEVLQRVPLDTRPAFAARLSAAAPAGAVFVPSADNPAHLRISGLAGLTRGELAALFPAARLAYVDMPPFPPGITRTSAQRERASSGLLEAVAMRVLDGFCAAEPYIADALKRRVAHIVCARWGA